MMKIHCMRNKCTVLEKLCRNDGKVFYKNSLPNEIPEMAVGLLLDESGSMSSCDRCTYARATAIILYDFCRGLDIPAEIRFSSEDAYFAAMARLFDSRELKDIIEDINGSCGTHIRSAYKHNNDDMHIVHISLIYESDPEE